MPENTTQLKTPKIFGIGLQKTATSSLGAALGILGYTVQGPLLIPDINEHHNPLPCVREAISTHDAFQDVPWDMIYKEVDAEYPGSKFILTVRDIESWCHSAKNMFDKNVHAPMRIWIYGREHFKRDVYITKFYKHIGEVVHYFRFRPQDLLILDIVCGEGWNKLCAFLDVPVPNVLFPHLNKTKNWII